MGRYRLSEEQEDRYSPGDEFGGEVCDYCEAEPAECECCRCGSWHCADCQGSRIGWRAS